MTTMPVPKGFIITSGFGPRAGGYHWGTDFGKEGGSGGQPIYAVRDGLVTRAGSASGFGKWITLDVDAAHGGGLYVYGHIIPEVTVGQRVMEGQRIGHINPDSSTNGGVAPHLHFEHHRYVWSQPGPDRLDPMQNVLAGARWKGETTKEEHLSTIFGVDVSEHQDGMSLAQAKREGMDFAIIRTTDGTHRDRCYRSHLEDAEGAGMITAAYHYLRNPSEGTTVAQQVQASLEVMGDKKRPMWIDVETNASLHVDHIRACKREFERRGVRVIGCYSYVPYWEGRIAPSEPDSHEFGAFWVAAYGQNRRGKPRDIYPGDQHRQWNYPLGNQKPALWQYGSNAQVAGYSVDINAYRGSRAELQALFSGEPAPEEEPSEEEMNKLYQQITTFISGYLGPQIDALQDVWTQLRGPKGKGWPQLGVNDKGQNLTLVDAVAALRQDLARIEKKLEEH